MSLTSEAGVMSLELLKQKLLREEGKQAGRERDFFSLFALMVQHMDSRLTCAARDQIKILAVLQLCTSRWQGSGCCRPEGAARASCHHCSGGHTSKEQRRPSRVRQRQ